MLNEVLLEGLKQSRPPTALPARSLGAPYPDTYNRSERLLREARGLRRDLSVQSEGWILGGGVFSQRRGAERCNNAKRDAWPLEAVAARVEAFCL